MFTNKVIRNSGLVVLTIILITTIALAYDFTYVREVKAHSEKVIAVDLPEGKSITEVITGHNELISCQFIDKGTGKVSLEEKDVAHCSENATLTLPEQMLVKVNNNNDKDVLVKVYVHDPDTKFVHD